MDTVAQLLLILSRLTVIIIGHNYEYNYFDGYYDYFDRYDVDRIAVANRGNGDVLLIESENEESQISIELDEDSEAMYVSTSFLTNEFYCGDRANSQFYIFDTMTLERVDIISGCNGIFHQYYNLLNQLWIVCDIDLTILVIDTSTKQSIITIEIADIQDTGFKPHDITANEEYAFVSLLKTNAPNGVIVQYSTTTFDEIKRLDVGGDPHLFLDPFKQDTDHLFVASQAVGHVYKIAIDTLIIYNVLHIPGAHGIWGNFASSDTTNYLYVTDITSDGTDALYVIDIDEFTISSTFDSIVPSAHNIMVNCEFDKLFITHTSEGIVSVYDIGNDGKLENQRIIFEEEGSLPFGVMCIYSQQYHARRYHEYYGGYNDGYDTISPYYDPFGSRNRNKKKAKKKGKKNKKFK